METQSNTPEGKVTAEEIRNQQLADSVFDREWANYNNTLGGRELMLSVADEEMIQVAMQKFAALHSADLTRQLESAREELERLRERLDDFGETEKCECDHTTPIVFNTHDDDGNATCPNCQIDYLNELITKGESHNKALLDDVEKVKLMGSGDFAHLRRFLMMVPQDKLNAVLQDHNLGYESRETVKALVSALEDAIERMDRARNILYKDEHSNWGILDSSKQVAALRKIQNP